MKYLVIHHTAGNQFISKPEDIGGDYEFYNKIITPAQIFDRHENLHPRGSFESYDVCLTGNFLIDTPTDFQREALKGLIKNYNLPIIRHKDLKDFGATIGTLETKCPGRLTTYTFKISSNRDIPELQELLLKYGLRLEVERFDLDVQGKPTGDEALKLVRDLGIKGSFILFCSGNGDQWIDAVTHYDSITNYPYTIAENSASDAFLVFEIAHQVQKYYVGHRKPEMPSVSIDDIYTPGEELTKKKFQSVMPYLPLLEETAINMLDKEDVRHLYQLAFYREPDDSELLFWTDKPLAEFLKTAILDRAKFLSAVPF